MEPETSEKNGTAADSARVPKEEKKSLFDVSGFDFSSRPSFFAPPGRPEERTFFECEEENTDAFEEEDSEEPSRSEKKEINTEDPRADDFFRFDFRRFLGKVLFAALLLAGVSACVAAVAFLALLRFAETLPGAEDILRHRPNETSVVYDSKNRPLAYLFLENRKTVPLEEISPWLVKAALAAEDASFYDHGGFRILSMARAFSENFSGKTVKQGGSTITQQLARNMFLTHERTFERKMKELIIAVRIELALDKKAILERYLNTVYFGKGAWGAETAANVYFGKKASELDAGEAATLAASIPAPNRFNPVDNQDISLFRRSLVLERMRSEGYLEKEQVAEIAAKPSVLRYEPVLAGEYVAAPYAASYVLFSFLLPRYGAEVTYGGGLRVYTTFDAEMCAEAEKAVSSMESEGAIVAMDPATGDLLAMAGGKDYETSKFNRATQAYRQPGSAFKPVVYALAFDSGASPDDIVSDSPVSFGKGRSAWRPKNYDGKFRGPVSLRSALTHSYNIPAGRLAMKYGATETVAMARRMGITSPHVPGNLVTALGAASVTPLEMTSVFATIANEGKATRPRFVTRILDADGQEIYSSMPEVSKAMSPSAAIVLRDTLKNVVTSGTGTRASVPGYETFGKTGTTNNYTDAWFVGGIPGITACVYAGNDDYKPLKGSATGGRIAAPVWKSFMEKAAEIAGTPKFFTISEEAAASGAAIKSSKRARVAVAEDNITENEEEIFVDQVEFKRPDVADAPESLKKRAPAGTVPDNRRIAPETVPLPTPVPVVTPKPSDTIKSEQEAKYDMLLKRYGLTN